MRTQPTGAVASVLLVVVMGLTGALAGCAASNQDRRLGWNAQEADAGRRCDAGSAPACGELGALLVENDSDKSDFERGLVLLEIACGRQVMPSCAKLARIYLHADDKRAHARARDLATRACAARTAEACTVVGEIARAEDPDDARGALDAFRAACRMGDARGCELYGLVLANDEVGGDRAAAEEAFGRACVAGRPSACHRLAMSRVGKPETRQEGLALLTDNCGRGHPPSCAVAAFQAAPVVSSSPACPRALPFAIRACQAKDRNACAVLDACTLEVARQDAPALARLRAACAAHVPLACLYWADRAAGAADRSDGAPDAEHLENAYAVACKGGFPAAAVGCAREASLRLARAKDETEAEAPLSALRQACAHASAEACCALGAAYRDGHGVPADADRATIFRAKACELGLDRCCAR